MICVFYDDPGNQGKIRRRFFPLITIKRISTSESIWRPQNSLFPGRQKINCLINKAIISFEAVAICDRIVSLGFVPARRTARCFAALEPNETKREIVLVRGKLDPPRARRFLLLSTRNISITEICNYWPDALLVRSREPQPKLPIRMRVFALAATARSYGESPSYDKSSAGKKKSITCVRLTDEQ